MPRKMYRNPEGAPASPEERPGPGVPREQARRRLHRDHKDEPSVEIDREYVRAVQRVEQAPPSVIVDLDAQKKERVERLRQTKRRVTELRAEVKKENERRRQEPRVSTRNMNEAEEAALGDELEAELESATDRLIEAEDRLRADPSIERAKEVERIREEAQEIYLAKHEVKPEPVPVAKSKPIERREPRTAEQEEMARAATGEVDRERARMEKRNHLLGERDDLKKRMEEMGGVWGGEAYFVLNERLQEIEKDLGKMGYAAVETQGKIPTAVVPTPEGPTPEDKIADARKAMKFIEEAEKEVAARQKKLQKELASHGLKTPGRIAEELGKIEEELRAEATGAKPTFWHRVRSLGRKLAGSEPTHAAKELLKKWVELETEMNGYLRQRADAQALIEAAEKEAGRERPSYQAVKKAMRPMLRRLDTEEAAIGAGVDLMPAAVRERLQPRELKAAMAMRKIQEEIENALVDVETYRAMGEEEMTGDKSAHFAKRIRALESQGKGEAFNQALEDAEEALMRYAMKIHEKQKAFEREAKAVTPDVVRPRSVIGMHGGEAGGAYAPGTPARRVVRLTEIAQTERARIVEQEKEAKVPERVNREVEMYRSVKWRKDLIDKINADPGARRAMHGVYEAFKHRMLEKLANEEELNFRTGSPDPALDYALSLYRKYARREDGKGYVYDREKRLAAHHALEEIEPVLGKDWDRDGLASLAVQAISRGKEALAKPGESYEEFRPIESEVRSSPDAVEMLRRLDAIRPDARLMSEMKKTLGMVGKIKREGLANQYALLKREAARGKAYAEGRVRMFELLVSEAEPEAPIPLTRLKPVERVPHVKRALSEKEMEAIEETDIPVKMEVPERKEEERYAEVQDAELEEVAPLTGQADVAERISESAVEVNKDEARLAKIKQKIRGIRKNKARMSALEKAIEGVKGESSAQRVNALYMQFRDTEDEATRKRLFVKVNAAREALGLRTWEEEDELETLVAQASGAASRPTVSRGKKQSKAGRQSRG